MRLYEPPDGLYRATLNRVKLEKDAGTNGNASFVAVLPDRIDGELDVALVSVKLPAEITTWLAEPDRSSHVFEAAK